MILLRFLKKKFFGYVKKGIYGKLQLIIGAVDMDVEFVVVIKMELLIQKGNFTITYN